MLVSSKNLIVYIHILHFLLGSPQESFIIRTPELMKRGRVGLQRGDTKQPVVKVPSKEQCELVVTLSKGDVAWNRRGVTLLACSCEKHTVLKNGLYTVPYLHYNPIIPYSQGGY